MPATPADIAVYDSLGLLYLDWDANAQQPNTPYPRLSDPVGPQGQWGVYTDEELRTSTALGTELALSGERYYDGSLGRFLMRGSGGINEYEAGGNSPTDGILSGIQLGVDAIGLIPLLNLPAEVISGTISAVQGDWVGVGLSAAALIPVAGDASVIAKIARRAEKLKRFARAAKDLSKAEGIGKYAIVKGHHILAKKAFAGAAGYDLEKALSIGNDFMKSRGWIHEAMTPVQQKLFIQLGKDVAIGVRKNTLLEHSQIAVKALMAGGASEAEARYLVARALQELRRTGIRKPTGIPWVR